MASHLQQMASPRIRAQQLVPQPNGHMSQPSIPINSMNSQQSKLPELKALLARQNEEAWILAGQCAEMFGELENAMGAYERAYQHNGRSVQALMAMASILRTQEQFARAAETLQVVTQIESGNGEAWGHLGRCYLMLDELQLAYTAYQQALYYLPNPKDPKLWYGIGILYDRYGSLQYAEEAFSHVMIMDSQFDKANEIYFRLGIIYKQQGKHSESLECFKYIVNNPPSPLTVEDIWFQIGHVYEQQKDFESATAAYKRVLERNPGHAKVLQQLGWLHHQQESAESQETAIDYLEKSVDSDNSDAQSWYLLGRCFMALEKHPKAYEAYQQAVYRDGRNPTFWCSIGVLYYRINQYRDALDAYSRAIRLNPYIPEVWYDLGTLYEACNNQVTDAIDAYQRAHELDPHNRGIQERLEFLRRAQNSGMLQPQLAAPPPQDIHPQSYGITGPSPHQLNISFGPQAAVPAPAPAPATAPPQQQQQQQPPPQQPPPQPQSQPGGEPWQRPPRPMEVRPPQQMDVVRNPPRQPSPHTMQARQFAEARQQPAHRGLSPTPKLPQAPPAPSTSFAPPSGAAAPQFHVGSVGPQPYPQAQVGRPYHSPPQPMQSAASEVSRQPAVPQTMNRVLNPHHNPISSSALSTPAGAPLMNGLGGGVPPGRTVPFGRVASPMPEGRPSHDALPAQGNVQQLSQTASIAQQPATRSGFTPVATSSDFGSSGAAIMRQRDMRPPSAAAKRTRDWPEEEGPVKKPASDEVRSKLEDQDHRRASSPPTRSLPPIPTPQIPRIAAQDPPRVPNPVHSPRQEDPLGRSLPPLNIATPGPTSTTSLPPLSGGMRSKEVSPRTPMPPLVQEEPPTRHMEVDENYDDEEPQPRSANRSSPPANFSKSSPLVSPKSAQDTRQPVVANENL